MRGKVNKVAWLLLVVTWLSCACSISAALPTYVPTLTELMISLGIYALGALLVTVLYKIALSVRGQWVSSRVIEKQSDRLTVGS